MNLETRPIILRIHSSKKKKGDESLYSELLLFFHWRDERILRQNCAQKFNTNYKEVEENKRMKMG